MCQKLWVSLQTKFSIFFLSDCQYFWMLRKMREERSENSNKYNSIVEIRSLEKVTSVITENKFWVTLKILTLLFDFSNFLSNHLWLKMYTLSDVQIKLKFKSHTTCLRLIRITKNKAFVLELTMFSINSKLNLDYVEYWIRFEWNKHRRMYVQFEEFILEDVVTLLYKWNKILNGIYIGFYI